MRKYCVDYESIVYFLSDRPAVLQRLLTARPAQFSEQGIASARKRLSEPCYSTQRVIMDGAAFKKALARLGYTQVGFAREHHLHVRTVQNWARVGPPDFVGPILNVMVQQSIEPPSAQSWPTNGAAAAEAAVALDHSLRSVLLRATQAGWPRDVILAGVMTWLADQTIGRR